MTGAAATLTGPERMSPTKRAPLVLRRLPQRLRGEGGTTGHSESRWVRLVHRRLFSIRRSQLSELSSDNLAWQGPTCNPHLGLGEVGTKDMIHLGNRRYAVVPASDNPVRAEADRQRKSPVAFRILHRSSHPIYALADD